VIAMAAPYFTRELFRFLQDLAANNDRDWFQANRDRYEQHVRQPALRFIADFGPWVRAVSPHLVCDPRPSGGSLFRIHRDVRFSADKSPYKTHAAIQFRHEAGKDAHAPGLYLHLEPGGCGAAAGVWRPPMPALRAIRAKVAAEPERWLAIVGAPALGRMERFGERLQRVPAGHAADHPAAEELKWKDWGAWAPLTQQDIIAGDTMERIGAVYQDLRPMLQFLCEALEQPF
jgi:uncharacterized protein (TIGR02453 family)